MKRFNIILAFLLLSLSALAQKGDAVLGIWQSEHGNGRIQIYKTGNEYNGKLVWTKKALDESGKPNLDVNNPNESLRSQPIKGLEVLKDFTYKSEGTWDGGTVYDPRSGKTYSAA